MEHCWQNECDRSAGQRAHNGKERLKLVVNYECQDDCKDDQQGSSEVFTHLALLGLGPVFVQVALDNHIGRVDHQSVRNDELEGKQNFNEPTVNTVWRQVVSDEGVLFRESSVPGEQTELSEDHIDNCDSDTSPDHHREVLLLVGSDILNGKDHSNSLERVNSESNGIGPERAVEEGETLSIPPIL